MSESGPKAKYSIRADVVCFAPNNGHETTAPACPSCANSDQCTAANRTLFDYLVGSGLQFDIARPPGLVEPRLQRAVEAQADVVARAGHGLHPVLLLACRCLGAEPDGDAAVRVHPDAWERAVESR